MRRRRALLTLAACAWLAGAPFGAHSRVDDPGSRLTRPLVEVWPGQVRAGAWTGLRFTLRVDERPLRHALLMLAVPSGWVAPSTARTSAGRVAASAGRLAVRGRTVAVRDLDLRATTALTITYGGGPGGVTTPTYPGRYTFTLSARAGGARGGVTVLRRVAVSVQAPASACLTQVDPRSSGRRLTLPDGVARTNLHNLASATGTVTQCHDESGLTTQLRLGDIRAFGAGPVGYPEAAYGDHLLDQPFCSPCRTQPFPMPVSAVLGGGSGDGWISATYSLGRPVPASLPVDFMYDLWLEHRPVAGRAPQPGDVEVILFLYEAGMTTCLDGGAATSATVAARLNRRPVSSRWRVCRIRGGTAATPVALYPLGLGLQPSREISLRVGDVLRGAEALLGRDLRHYWLLGIELGGEFDQCSPAAGCVSGVASWRWHVSRLEFERAVGSIPIVFGSS